MFFIISFSIIVDFILILKKLNEDHETVWATIISGVIDISIDLGS